MATAYIICYKYDYTDTLVAVLEQLGYEVKVCGQGAGVQAEVDFVACFDCDLLVCASNATYEQLVDFIRGNRLAVLLERRLAGGQKVICVANFSNMLFSGDDQLDKLYPELSEHLLEQYLICTTAEVSNCKVLATQIENQIIRSEFAPEYECVTCREQYNVYADPAEAFGYSYMRKPESIFYTAEGKKYLLAVYNGALSAFLCSFTDIAFSCFMLAKAVDNN